MNTYTSLFGVFFLLWTTSLTAQTKVNTNKTLRIKPFKRTLHFGIDEIELTTKSIDVLDKLAKFLNENEHLHLKISGHSNGSCDTEFCEEIANQRAETVAFYLLEKGISPLRMQYNGYGKKKPVATNRTAYGKQKNQRVDILVFTGK